MPYISEQLYRASNRAQEHIAKQDATIAALAEALSIGHRPDDEGWLWKVAQKLLPYPDLSERFRVKMAAERAALALVEDA